MNANLYDLFASCFPSDRRKACMLLEDGDTRSYADLEAASARFANALVTLGCEPGDRVAVQIEKSPGALALYLGCLRAGLVYLPLNTAYQRDELSYFISDAEPKVLVSESDKLAMLRDVSSYNLISHTLHSVTALAQEQTEAFSTVARAPEDIAAILYTSGTTGRSKGAMLSHRNLAANGQTLIKYWGFGPDDVLLHMLPIYHIHGLFVATHCVLLSGASMRFVSKFDPKQAVTLLPKCTVFMGVPTFYTRLLAEPSFTADKCETIRLFVSGSAPMLPETFEAFHQRTGQFILERYGMTETGMNTSNPLVGERLPGTAGLPLPGVFVRVVDDEGRELPHEAPGQLQVKGDNVFTGYWRRPDKNAEEFTTDGYFKTGDIAEVLSNGYVKLVGRAKDLIITGGLNVYPKEIEELIDAMPGVSESAVVGLPDPDYGEAVTAIVVPKASDSTLDANAIISDLKTRLAGFKIPKSIYFVDELPRNAMGKVQKNVLRERYSRQT
jgi:malonyl-CoA/methylmalonyl-CoA synthetase